MDQNAWIMLLVGVAVTAGLFALGVAVYPKVKSAQPSTPVEAVVEAALLPIIYQGICAAFRLNEMSLVKHVVTRERFEQLTQDAFDRFNRFYVEHQAHFDDLFNKWKTANAPVPLPSTVARG
jgi:hypothetical protein